MGRASVRKNKNVWQLAREACGLTREEACARLGAISLSRLERIEYDQLKSVAPEDVVLMAEHYHAPQLRNHYCAHCCPIGSGRVGEIASRPVSETALGILDTINELSRLKDRMIAILADGRIDPGEEGDFDEIRSRLDRMNELIGSLKLWAEDQ